MKKLIAVLGAGLLVGSDSRLVRVDAQSRQIVWKTELAGKVKAGGKGVWGQIPMPPNNVTPEEAKTLVAWILSLK